MDTDEMTCGLDVALIVMGGKWKPIILYHLRSGPLRFGDLKRLVRGVSPRMLSQELRELAAAGVLLRHDHQQSTPNVDYTLTPFGVTLVVALLPLSAWGAEHRTHVEDVMLSPVSEQHAESSAYGARSRHQNAEGRHAGRDLPRETLRPG